MAQLSPADYEKLKDMLTDLEVVVDDLKGNSQNFVRDQIERHIKWGDRMFVSPKQLDWLKNLHEEWCGTVQHRAPKEERELGEEDRDDDRGFDDEIPF